MFSFIWQTVMWDNVVEQGGVRHIIDIGKG